MMALGADIIDFYDNHFPEGCYHDENELEMHNEDGSWALSPTESYDLAQLGVLVPDVYGKGISFTDAFQKWQSAHKKHEDMFRDMLSKFFGPPVQFKR